MLSAASLANIAVGLSLAPFLMARSLDNLVQTDIVIVNWNSGAQLQACIESVRAHGEGHVGRCIVVDNGSHDGSTGFLGGAQDVDLVETGQNLGFGKACNLGAERGRSPFILFLNPDAFLLPGALAAPLAFLSAPENAKVGIAGIALENLDGSVQRTCSYSPSPARLLARSLGLDLAFPGTSMRMTSWDHAESREVDQVIGAFFCVRRSLFKNLSGFDERFFVYFEEVDFSRRAAQAGYSSHFLREASAFHAGGGVSSQVKAQRLFYSLRSRIQYGFKHFSRPAAFGVALVTLMIEPLTRLAQLLLKRRWSEIGDLRRGFGMLWRWALGALVARPRLS